MAFLAKYGYEDNSTAYMHAVSYAATFGTGIDQGIDTNGIHQNLELEQL